NASDTPAFTQAATTGDLDSRHSIFARVKVSRTCSLCEGHQQAPVRFWRRGKQALLFRYVLSRPLQELSTGRLALADQRSNFVVVEIEHIAKQQDCALGGRQTLEHDHESHRDLVEHLYPSDAPILEIDRFGQAIATVFLAARFR